ncbi:helix-turn-helix domain-containing protein [Halarcobacter sp.]|jgi:transcriptional regulator with XRE-family HTH domain|uniref:helix-turn-helix domain-containing protein n=1 Tax=Halarcobacter sp. TaxID=2321133 RepID=UPI0029F58D08|nr:helix-turn-helix domain-containing protein [Halarcobacter sp.]
MIRQELIEKVKSRKKEVKITIEDLAEVSELGTKTLSRFFAGHDVKLSTIEKLTQTLGLDLAGNEIVDIETLKERRAELKALQIVSLVQDTSSLEEQGLEQENIKDLLKETKELFLTGKYKINLWK